MADILEKLQNAEHRVQQEPTVKEDGTVFNPKVSNDAQEMYNILNKLQNATENAAKTLVKESVETQTSDESFGVGGLNVVLNKTTVYGYKRLFTISLKMVKNYIQISRYLKAQWQLLKIC